MSVRIELSNNRILLASEAATPGLQHAIPGAYWRANTGVWSLPLELATCHILRERFGKRLVVGPRLWEWAKAERVRRDAADAQVAAADAILKLVPAEGPELYAAMDTRRYQRAGVRYITDAEGRDDRRRALLADTVGLGKSLQALGAVLENGMPGPYLIISPKTAVESTWAREVHKWLPDDNVIMVPQGKAQREAILEGMVNVARMNREDAQRGTESLMSLARTWVIVHPYMIRTQTWFVCGAEETDVAGTKSICGCRTKYKVGPIDELDCGHEKDRRTKTVDDHTFPQLFQINWSAVIVDEADQILIRKTGTPNLQRRGSELLRDLVPEGGLRLAISGTPFRSKPHQIWSTLNWLDPVRWRGKWSFIQRYWVPGGYSGYEVSEENFIEEREAMLIDELKDVMIRRTRDVVAPELPPKMYPSNINEERDGLTPGIYLPMTKEQKAAYQQMAKEGEADLAGGTVRTVGTLAELTRLKQFANSVCVMGDDREVRPIAAGNKFDWLTAFLLKLGFPGTPSTKLVIASQFTKLLKVFAGGLKQALDLGDDRIGGITGEITAAQRSRYIDAFEDTKNPLGIMFLNLKAGGSSITLDAAEVMVCVDEDWIADVMEQVEGRIDNRQPEKRIVPRSYYYLRSLGTLEEGIAAANAVAKAQGKRVLDGAEIARRSKELIIP